MIKTLTKLYQRPAKAKPQGKKQRAPKPDITRKRLMQRADELGLFVTEARKDHIYVPRKRVADKEATPPVLDRDLEGFYAIADKVISDGRTMMRYERLFTIWQALANTRDLDGAMAEIGVWRGGTSYLISAGRRRFAGKDAPMVLVDTFKGHPGDTIDPEADPGQRAGGFAGTSVERVKAYLADFPLCEIHEGDATEVIEHLGEKVYFLVHIDTDIYQSTLKCLEYFHPRLESGGVIVVDDFGAKRCSGVSRAVHEYLPALTDCELWQMRTEQCLIVRK
jgi:O-methyltransferase